MPESEQDKITMAALQVIQFTEQLYDASQNSNKYLWALHVLEEAVRLETEYKDQAYVSRQGGSR